MKVILPEYIGHSPKNKFLEMWVFDYLTNPELLRDKTNGNLRLKKLNFSKDTHINILYGISHGKVGSVLLKVFEREKNYFMSFHLEFETFKAEKISSCIITSEEGLL